VISQEEVVAGIKQGDQNSLALLYKQYGSALYGIITRILPSDEDASEILQDSFVKVWNNIEKYDPVKATLFTWVSTIARNTALDKKRLKSYERAQSTQSIDMQINEPAVGPQTTNLHVPEIIQRIPEKYRILVDKMFLQGYTQQEISDEMDIPLGTVKTRLREAISILRNELKSEHHLLYILSLV
jgi:RNA polymerase sigma-70 factor (ECF subfamily)